MQSFWNLSAEAIAQKMVCIAYVTGTKKGQNIFKHILKIFTSKTYKKKSHEFFEKIIRILN